MKQLTFALLWCFPVFLFGQTTDSTVIKQVDGLIQETKSFIVKRDLDKALKKITIAENIALNELGAESVIYGSCCFNHGKVLHIGGNRQEAEIWYLKSKSIWEKASHTKDPAYVGNLINLAILYAEQGNYITAKPLYLQAKMIFETQLKNKKHPFYSICLSRLGVLYIEMEEFKNAELILLELRGIQEEVLGEKHPAFANTLNDMGILYEKMGEFERAEIQFIETQKIKEEIFGKEHPSYASTLHNMANLYLNMAQLEKAELFYLEAKTITSKTIGKENPDYAGILIDLSGLYFYMGRYDLAERLLFEAKDIFEVRLKEVNHPFYFISLRQLAILYSSMGNYEKAEPIYQKVKNIYAKSFGTKHPEYAGSLINLGLLYMNIGDYQKSDSLLVVAKLIFEEENNKEHPFYANCLTNQAITQKELGNYQEAKQLYQESKIIIEKIHGKEHPAYASSIANLGTMNYELGDLEEAESLYFKAISIWEQIFGKEHPDYIKGVNSLAKTYLEMGDSEKAEAYFSELSHANQKLISNALHHLSEKELNFYLKEFSDSQLQTLSFVQETNNENGMKICFDDCLFNKGFLLHSASQIKRLAQTDSVSIDLFNLIKSYQGRLATQYAKPIISRDSALIERLETTVNKLEKELVQRITAYGQALRQVNWQEVQQSLREGEAVIEFVHYQYFNKKSTDSIMYAALLLLPNSTQPQFFSLFEEKQLYKFLNNENENKFSTINNIYKNNSLYELLWKPLEKNLVKIKTIYYAPSGLLHRINLNAISSDGKITLNSKYNLVQLNSTRQLVIPTIIENKANEALIFGGINYEVDKTITATSSLSNDFESTATRGLIHFSQIDSTLKNNNWTYLDWTEVEINSIESILKESDITTNLYSGYQAKEEAFKAINLPSPRILHIATHGFFFPDPETMDSSIGTGSEPIFKTSDHPMIRSGLILAGANHAWKTGKPFKPNMEDGILTAYEISQMDLSNTELVVLSACDTGLGDIEGNEGVYGLQRAFKIAGAKYLIMSLWQVPDYQTQQLMTVFYNNWLTKKMSIPDAFRLAQKKMQEKYEDPFLWAGFVLVE